MSVEVSKKQGVKIIINDNGNEKVEVVGVSANNEVDYPTLHAKFLEVKKSYPSIFKIELNPDADVPYKEIVRIMDEARKARQNNIAFPVHDEKTGKDSTTNYMFPEVVFANMMDG